MQASLEFVETSILPLESIPDEARLREELKRTITLGKGTEFEQVFDLPIKEQVVDLTPLMTAKVERGDYLDPSRMLS